MNISYDELRQIKHDLPTGSVTKIAETLSINEQTVRNYFGAHKYEKGDIATLHIQPGPKGGVVQIEDERILDLARDMIQTSKS